MKRTTLTLVAALAALVTLVPATASAQFRHRRDPRPMIVRHTWGVRPLVDRAERESNAFRAWFERNYDRRNLGRYHDNRWLKGQIQDLDESMERLRSKADDRRPGVGREQLLQALSHARQIDREIRNDRDTRFTVGEWNDLRRTLNDLARLYDVRGV